MKCSKCGKKINKSFKLCPHCGEKVEIVKKQNKFKFNTKFLFIIGGIVLFLIILILIFILNSKPNFDKLKSSVVLLNIYDENNQLISSGSGVVAFENDIVLTNAHVIEDNHKIEVISENNTKYQVEGILDYNKKKDIAILKLTSSKGLKTVKIGNKVKAGTDVTAIGSPLGLKNTISTGIISANFQDNIEVYQHTAPISPGSSGGALFDSKGNLIGITYASITSGQNLNLAIPISHYEKSHAKIKNNDIIDTKYYYLLNNQIIKTKKGVKLIKYILNDKYQNTKPLKSELMEDFEKGHIEYNYSGWNNTEIGKYVTSSIQITSGVVDTIETVIRSNSYKINDGNYYSFYILKLNKNDDKTIKEVKSYLIENLTSPNTYKPSRYEINSKNNYVYALECKNYDDCDTVKKLIEDIINQ